ncbi:hypothetical protein [Streptomyces sp. NPDC004788]
MLRPVVEIYVVWHPGDRSGQGIAERVSAHFRGDVGTGLISNPVETYVRSAGFRGPDDAPLPIPFQGQRHSGRSEQGHFTVVVPVLGDEWIVAAEDTSGPWHAYARAVTDAWTNSPRHVGVFPVWAATPGGRPTALEALFPQQRIGAPRTPEGASPEPWAEVLCRELTQGIAQLVAADRDGRLQVFVSHTRQTAAPDEPVGPGALADLVMSVIGRTRVHAFLDAVSLQPGEDFTRRLYESAGHGAFLAVMTDLYSTRHWCLEELWTAKQAGIPIVMLDALTHGEKRASSLTGNARRVPVRRLEEGWSEQDVFRGVNLLVDDYLSYALWRHQSTSLRRYVDESTTRMSFHAPEAETLTAELKRHAQTATAPSTRHRFSVLHSGAPVRPTEAARLRDVASLRGLAFESMTPQQFVALDRNRMRKNGGTYMSDALPTDALKGMRISISVATSADLDRLGLAETQFRTVLGELAQLVVTAGGKLAYGGNLRQDGYTLFLIEQMRTYAPSSRPLLNCLAWTEHRKLSLSELDFHREQFGRYGEIVCLSVDGEPVDPAAGRGEAPAPEADAEIRHRALTGMRRYLMRHADAHLLLGGKRGGFRGALPGLVEEALLALEAGLPIYLAAGYGGVTAEIARALGLGGAPEVPHPSDATPPDPRFVDGLERLRALADAPEWAGLSNGLTDEENRQLAGSHYPQEIAALASRGLGRLRRGT